MFRAALLQDRGRWAVYRTMKSLAGITYSDIVIESNEVVRHELHLIESISINVDAGSVGTNARQLRSLLFGSRSSVVGFGRFTKQAQREQTYQGTNRE
jgi:hypothetical protein